jgi:hypothetical protein
MTELKLKVLGVQFTRIATHECVFYGPHGYTIGNVNPTQSPELCTRGMRECPKKLREKQKVRERVLLGTAKDTAESKREQYETAQGVAVVSLSTPLTTAGISEDPLGVPLFRVSHTP